MRHERTLEDTGSRARFASARVMQTPSYTIAQHALCPGCSHWSNHCRVSTAIIHPSLLAADHWPTSAPSEYPPLRWRGLSVHRPRLRR